ncbi:MAG: site-specific integrase [Sulfurimonas sp.]|nr:site-specific integrase [Sulfurimonas sp.]
MRKNKLEKIKTVPGLYKYKNINGNYEYIAKVKINYKIKQRNLTKHYQVINQTEAKRVLELFKSEIIGKTIVRGDKITLNTFFYDTYIKTKNEPIQKEYTSYYKCHIKEDIGHFSLSDIRKSAIQTEINKMYNKKKPNGKPYSNRTVAKYQEILRNVFNEAIDSELIESNPASRLKIQVVDNERNLYYIIKSDFIVAIKKLLEEIDKVENQKYKLCLLMLVFTGRRVRELLQLRYIDIDFSTNFILSRKEKKKNKRQSGLIYLNNEIMGIIKQLQQDNSNDTYIFQSKSKKNQPYLYSTIKEHNKKVIKNTDIEFFENETLYIHDYRHFFGQIMRKRIKDLLLIKMVLDHSDTDITTIYSQYGPEDSQEVLNQYYNIVRNNTV